MQHFVGIGLMILFTAGPAKAQGNSGRLKATVKDPLEGHGGAGVEISYAVSGYQRTATRAATGRFRFTNIPFNTYHMVITASGFASATQDVDVRSKCSYDHLGESEVWARLQQASTVEANGGDLLETESTFHTDVDRGLFDKMPLESQSSSVSSLVTLASPGVVADSNGLFHGLGDHAENSFSVDGQPITDQQSKVFSNQIPVESIQSLEVISGAPQRNSETRPAWSSRSLRAPDWGKLNRPVAYALRYGSFGSVSGGFDVAFGGQKWGNLLRRMG